MLLTFKLECYEKFTDNVNLTLYEYMCILFIFNKKNEILIN